MFSTRPDFDILNAHHLHTTRTYETARRLLTILR